jgi:hypothetical protein
VGLENGVETVMDKIERQKVARIVKDFDNSMYASSMTDAERHAFIEYLYPLKDPINNPQNASVQMAFHSMTAQEMMNSLLSVSDTQHFQEEMQCQYESEETVIVPIILSNDETQWVNINSKPKPIQWDMMKILEKKCWKCQHWVDWKNYMFQDGYCCTINSDVSFVHDINTYVSWTVLKKKDVFEKDGLMYMNADSRNNPYKRYLLEDCPCYTETHEYHEWKEQHPFLLPKLKVTEENIIL